MDMDPTKMTLTAFADELASDSPAPGGGSVSALTGSLGAALTAMVAGLTVNKKKFEDRRETVGTVMTDALQLKEELLTAVDRDTEAFNIVSAAFSLPKSTEEEKAIRSNAIQQGLLACIESPLTIMELCRQALRLAETLSQGFNASAASDLGVSVLMLKGALQGAWLNVKINLGGLKDREASAAYEEKGEKILAECLPLADALYRKVEAMVQQ